MKNLFKHSRLDSFFPEKWKISFSHFENLNMYNASKNEHLHLNVSPWQFYHYLNKKRIEVFWSLTLIWLIRAYLQSIVWDELWSQSCRTSKNTLDEISCLWRIGRVELYLKYLFKYVVEIYLHIMACGHGCLPSAVFLLPFLLDCSTDIANASKTIPRRKFILRGTIGSGWEEGSNMNCLCNFDI